MWFDENNWLDTNDWTDTEVLIEPTDTEVTVVPAIIAPVERVTEALKGKTMVISTGEITDAAEFSNGVPAGHMFLYLIIEETAGNATTVKAGTTIGGDEIVTATACAASSITSIHVGRLLSMSADTTIHVTFTTGTGFECDIYLVILKVL